MSSIADRLGPNRLLHAGVGLFVVSTIAALSQSRTYEIPMLIANGAYVAVGGLIVVRRPGNVLGLLLVAYGALWAAVTAGVVIAASLDEAGRLDAAAWVALAATVLTAPGIWLLAATWLLFPDGHTSTRWDRRLLGGSGVLAAALTLAGLFATPQVLPETKAYPHPFVDDSVAQNIYDTVGAGTIVLFLFGMFVAVRLILRMRHGDPIERMQVRWIAAAVILNITILMVNVVFQPLGTDDRAFWLIDAVGIVLIPLGIGVAIFRYRLYDIDVVISKSVTYLGLAAAISLLYAAVVVVPLLLIGVSDGDGPGLLLPIVATAVVAVLFEPMRVRMQRWANRLVYGKRTTPHEVLSNVTARLADSSAGDSTDDLAQLVAEGTGADQAVVWLGQGDDLRPSGIWSDDPAAALTSSSTLLPVADELSAVTLVRHEDQQLGALSIVKPKTDPVTPADRQVLADVAAGAGLLLRNIRLNQELEIRADEVRASRQRLIAAQDAERHRLERDLHDGAQQQVVALKVKLGIAKTIAEREDADEVAAQVSALAGETQDAVDALRAVAHGIYPPLLESEGLGPALRAVERSADIPVELDLSDVQRYPRPVEETVYFCVLETLERVRMSGATDARVGVTSCNGDLVTEVAIRQLETDPDLTAVSDRLDAAGGTFRIQSQPDRGCSITGSLPAPALAGQETGEAT